MPHGSHIANHQTREKFAIRVTTAGWAPSHSSHMRKPKPLWHVKEWLAYKGMKARDLVDQTGHSKSEISEWINGKRRFNADVLDAFARVIGVDPGDLFRLPGGEALLIGKVGAGAEITRMEHPDILEGIPLPPGMNAPNAAIIEGDSQYPLKEDWVIFYGPENEGIPDKCVGELCVVQVKDGPTLLKTLKRGSRKGLWNLESWNAMTREDQKIEWAALVMDIRPR